MKKYRLYSGSIKAYEVVKETPKQIVYLKARFFNDEKLFEEREMKVSYWHSWHDTFEQAKNHLIEDRKKEINVLLIRIKKLEDDLADIELLKEEITH